LLRGISLVVAVAGQGTDMDSGESYVTIQDLQKALDDMRVDRDRWRSAAGIMYEQVFQLKRLDEIQIERIEKAMLAYGKAYNEG
jgi:ribosome maturation protein Sdo1